MGSRSHERIRALDRIATLRRFAVRIGVGLWFRPSFDSGSCFRILSFFPLELPSLWQNCCS